MPKITKLALGGAGAAAAALSFVPHSAAAQGRAAGSTVLGLVTSGLCMRMSDMTEERLPLPQVRTVLVAADDAKNYLAKGFVVVPCGKQFATHAMRELWRDRICSLAGRSNVRAITMFAERTGEMPAVLCGSAELIAGPWQRQTVELDGEGGAQ